MPDFTLNSLFASLDLIVCFGSRGTFWSRFSFWSVSKSLVNWKRFSKNTFYEGLLTSCFFLRLKEFLIVLTKLFCAAGMAEEIVLFLARERPWMTSSRKARRVEIEYLVGWPTKNDPIFLLNCSSLAQTVWDEKRVFYSEFDLNKKSETWGEMLACKINLS